MADQNLKISDPFTLAQIEEKYTNCILTQDFYDIDYASGWLKNIEPAIDLADPAQSLDVFNFKCELDNSFIPEFLLKNRDFRTLGIALKFLGSTS